jgi:histidyl-tRNA synthetase
LAQRARAAGLSAQLELAGRSLKGQLRHADRIGACYVAIVGEDGRATLRDMSSGEQREIPTDGVVVAIKQGRA